MKARLGLSILLILSALAGGWYWLHQNTLVPIPLSEGRGLYVRANPEFGQDTALLEALLPAGPELEAFLVAQSDLALIERDPAGGWAGQLLAELEVSRHGRRWRLTLRPGWRMQDGSLLAAPRVASVLGPEVEKLGGEIRLNEPSTLILQFKTRPEDPVGHLSRWRMPGTGPFLRQGHVLRRFDGFIHGKAGIAGLSVVTDPALLQSRPWAEGLVARRWAWAAFPGGVAPEDMARVRLAPYDELRLKDGSVWFLSRRMRRLRPDADDWTRTRLFGVWKGAMDLPYDPLGL